jgi:Zn finger protein HypA/HybF involved in hydrogenase expression
MHEQAIAQTIIAAAKEQERLRGKLKGIVVEVGALGHLPAGEMREVLVTLCPDWEVVVVEKPATVLCDECGYKGTPKILEKGHDHNVYKCPKCGFMMPEIITGHDIVLKEVELADT